MYYCQLFTQIKNHLCRQGFGREYYLFLQEIKCTDSFCILPAVINSWRTWVCSCFSELSPNGSFRMNNLKETFKLFWSACVQNTRSKTARYITSHPSPSHFLSLQMVWIPWNLEGVGECAVLFEMYLKKKPAPFTWPVNVDSLLHGWTMIDHVSFLFS